MVLAIGSLSGIGSLFYFAYSRWVKISLSVDMCYPVCVSRSESYPSASIGTVLTIRNKGNRPTSIESFKMELKRDSLKAVHLHTKRYPDREGVDLPVTVEPDTTIKLEALFVLEEGRITRDVDCKIIMTTTHKKKIKASVRCVPLPLRPGIDLPQRDNHLYGPPAPAL